MIKKVLRKNEILALKNADVYAGMHLRPAKRCVLALKNPFFLLFLSFFVSDAKEVAMQLASK